MECLFLYICQSLNICTSIQKLIIFITSMPNQTHQSKSSVQNSDQTSMFFPSRVSLFKNSSKFFETSYTSNYYQIQFPKDIILYKLIVEAKPQISPQNKQLQDNLMKNVYSTLKEQLNLIFWDNRQLWSLKNFEEPIKFSWTPSKTNTDQKFQYEITILSKGKISLIQNIKNEQKISLSKMLNFMLKSKLIALDLTQFKKQHFYKIQSLSQDCLTEVQVEIIRGFYVSIIFLSSSQICLKVFPIEEILQINSFLQTLKNSKNQKFKNQFVVARYGKFKTYKVENIQLQMTPLSTFFDHQKNRQISFKDYYLQKYQIQIQFKDQPLVRVSQQNYNKHNNIRHEKDIFLIPQLLALIGLTKSQRQDISLMTLVQSTKNEKNNIKNRVEDLNKFIQNLNSKFGEYSKTNEQNIQSNSISKELQFKVGQSIRMKGYQIQPVNLIFENQKKVLQVNGNFSHRQPLYEKGKFQDWMIFYSNLTPQNQIQSFHSKLKKVSNELGVKVQDAFFCKIQYPYQNGHQDSLLKEKLWIKNIEIQLQKYNQLPQFVICYFKPQETHFCYKLNKIFINKYGVKFQNINSCSFEKKPFSILTQLLILINQKLGYAPWKIDISRLKTIYCPDSFSVACVSYSFYKKQNQYVYGFIGNSYKQSNKIFTFSRTGIQNLDQLTTEFYQIPFNSWLKWCYTKNINKNHSLPKVIIIYRKQIHAHHFEKQIKNQVQALKDVIRTKMPKKLNYDPQIIVLNIEEDSNSVLFTQKPNFNLIQANCGSFTVETMSKANAQEFHLVSKYQLAKCNVAVGYRLVYRNKFSVSQEDLIAFTYSQCFNFCGSYGSQNVPSWLICAQKLSKFVGKFIEQNVVKKHEKQQNSRKQEIIDSYYFL